MIRKIVLPLDGSRLAETAFPHALRCARATNSLIMLVHALPTSANNQSDVPTSDPVDWRLRKMEAEMYLKDVAMLFSGVGVKVDTALLEGDPAECISQFATEQDADLIVMSSHGRSGLTGSNLSSIVQNVILATTTSVMIVPAYRSAEAYPDKMHYRQIIAPLDGSRRAESVLPFLTALGKVQHTQTHLVTAAARPEMPTRAPLSAEDARLVDEIVARNRDEAEIYLTQLQSRIGGNVSKHVLVGDNVVGTLHNFIREQDADLVVFSAHGHSGDGTRRYGRLVTSFFTYSSIPLVIIQDLDPSEIVKSDAEVAAKEMSELPKEARTVVNAFATA